MLLIPAFGRQKQADVFEFEASLFYRASYRTAMATQKKKSVSKIKMGGW